MTMANQKIQATEYLVGQNHATLSDTLNRLVVGVNDFRLIKSGATLTLEAVNGNLVDINGDVFAVTTLPTLAAPAGTTFYYIYLYNNSGTANLEYSTTGYTVDSKGRAAKTGTATKRLMGMARTVSGAWVDTAAQRLVVSRDNRRSIYAANTVSASTASGSLVELSSGSRAEFLTWAFESILLTNSGAVTDANACVATSGLNLDASTLTSQESSVGAGAKACVSIAAVTASTDGYHYVTAMGATTAGTATWGVNVMAVVQG